MHKLKGETTKDFLARQQEKLARVMREAGQTIALLRNALVALVGADDKEQLEQMEAYIRSTPAPDDDKINIINAIHVILKTQETK